MDYYTICSFTEVSDQRIQINPNSRVRVEYRRAHATFPHPFEVWGVIAKKQLSSDQLIKIPESFRNQLIYNEDGGYNRIAELHLIKRPMGRTLLMKLIY